MDKEKILEMSRAENKNQDERERAAMARAGQVASAVGGIVCGLFFVKIRSIPAQCVFCPSAL